VLHVANGTQSAVAREWLQSDYGTRFSTSQFFKSLPQRIAASQPASGWSQMSMLYSTEYEHTWLFYINYRLDMKIKTLCKFPGGLFVLITYLQP
jgi:hypothetical protein